MKPNHKQELELARVKLTLAKQHMVQDVNFLFDHMIDLEERLSKAEEKPATGGKP